MWATATLLLAVAALPLAATHVPTSVVEFEDRQVIKAGGELYPGPWVPYRPRSRGSWKLGAGESVQIPVVAGGQHVSIEIDLLRRGGSSGVVKIEAHAGSNPLGSWPLGFDPSWQTLTIESRECPPCRFLCSDGVSG